MENRYLSLEEARAQQTLAQTIFNDEFRALKSQLEKQENRSFQVIIGVLIASVLILVTLVLSVIIFMANFNEMVLDGRQEVSQNLIDTNKANESLETTLRIELEKLEDHQNYLEGLLMEQAVD